MSGLCGGFSFCCVGDPETFQVDWSAGPVGIPPYFVIWGGDVIGDPQSTATLPITQQVILTGPTVTVDVIDFFGQLVCSASRPTTAISGPTNAHVTGGGSLCNGQSGTIRVDLTTTSTTEPGWVLEWSDGVTETINLPGSSHTHFRTVTPSATTTYSVDVVRPISGPFVTSCGNVGTGSATFTHTLYPLPTAAMIGSGTAICPGGSALVTALLGSSLPGPYTWNLTWSDGHSETVTSPFQPYWHYRIVTPSATTAYAITSIDEGCSTASASGVGATTVTVTGAPPVTVSAVSISGGVLTVNGAGFTPASGQVGVIHMNQTALPTTVVSSTELTAPVGSLGPVGGASVYVTIEASNCWLSVSNVVPAVWDPSRTNRGTVINLASGGGGTATSTMTFRVGGGEPNQPLSLILDLGDPAGGLGFMPPVSVLGGQVLSTYSASLFPLFDGLNVLGAWGAAPPASLDANGEFEITIDNIPAIYSGVPFRLQGVYADPNHWSGIRLTWPFAAQVP